MADNYAIRIENQRFSYPAYPCGSAHGYILEVIGVAYDGSRPTIFDGQQGRYIEGSVARAKIEGADTEDFFDQSGNIDVELLRTKGMYVRGEVFSCPEKNASDIDAQLLQYLTNLVIGGEEGKPKVITLLDKPTVEDTIHALGKFSSQSYEGLIVSALSDVVMILDNQTVFPIYAR